MLLLWFIEHGLFLFDEDRTAAVTVLPMHVFTEGSGSSVIE
jgi:hypothetical protein